MLKLVFVGIAKYEGQKNESDLLISQFRIEIDDDGNPIVTVNGEVKEVDKDIAIALLSVLANNQ
jgi:hypothetical protein